MGTKEWVDTALKGKIDRDVCTYSIKIKEVLRINEEIEKEKID